MRMAALTALLLCVALSLAGCSGWEIEDHAYALVLGVDETSSGGIELTIQFPRFGQPSEASTDSGGESEQYLTVSADGDSYAEALERLQWSVARELNLSHIKLVIASYTLAESECFPALIAEIAETRHLYTTAGFVICEGRARTFVNGMKMVQGTRLSREITAQFRHFADHGFIPQATFADLYYGTGSGMSDTLAIMGYANAESGADEATETFALLPEDASRTESASSSIFLGGAILHDGRLARRLDARETLCLNLATRKVDGFTYMVDGIAYPLSSTLPPSVKVSIGADGPTIEVSVYLTSETILDARRCQAIEAALGTELSAFINSCQRDGLEPFGFAAKAAAHFPTYASWQAYDWRARFQNAQIHVNIAIAST